MTSVDPVLFFRADWSSNRASNLDRWAVQCTLLSPFSRLRLVAVSVTVATVIPTVVRRVMWSQMTTSAHLIYKLCASEDTRVSVLDRLRNVSASPDKEAFFPHVRDLAFVKA